MQRFKPSRSQQACRDRVDQFISRQGWERRCRENWRLAKCTTRRGFGRRDSNVYRFIRCQVSHIVPRGNKVKPSFLPSSFGSIGDPTWSCWSGRGCTRSPKSEKTCDYISIARNCWRSVTLSLRPKTLSSSAWTCRCISIRRF